MTGFHDLDYERRQRQAKRIDELAERIDRLTVDDLFQPIASCSTLDRQVVELLVGDRVMTGFFDSVKGRWMCNGGKDLMPEGLYPSHWRPLRGDR